MAESTSIEWCDATFNPWWGCTKVSPACDHCYAERDAKRYQPGKVLWGVGADRRTFGDKHWNEPLRWARTMPAKLGRRPRVFCASMADWLDLDAPIAEFVKLLDTIRRTPELDWLLLSKRIGNWRKRLAEAREHVALREPQDNDVPLLVWIDEWRTGTPPANVWLGATVVNQEEADRDVPKLLAVPARVRFLSIEPMLGPARIRPELLMRIEGTSQHGQRFIDWIICGGESGPHARPMHPDWARSLRDQCAAAGVPFLFKQWGEWAEHDGHRPTRVFSMDTDVGETLARRCDGFISVAGEFVRDMDDATTDEPYRGMVRVGKKAAGRHLDGRTHDGFPGD